MQPFDLVVLALATYYASVTVARLHGPFGLAERLRHAVYRRRGFEPEAIGLVETDAWRRVAGPDDEPIVEDIDDDWLASGISCPLCVSLYAGAVLALAWYAGGAPGQAAVGVLAIAGGASAVFSAGRYW